MFILNETVLTFSCGTVESNSRLVAKCEDKDVLEVVISQTLHNAYESAVAKNDTMVTFNGYTIEDVEQSDRWLEEVEQRDALVIVSDIGCAPDSTITTYNIIEDKSYGGKCYE